MNPYYQVCWTSELEHFGIKGMKWGIRRYQNLDGTLTEAGRKRLGYKNLKNAKTSNFDKWGKSENTNTLWITGYSGSGKSTVALSVKRKNDKVIHLDIYADDVSAGAGVRDKEFDKFLDRNAPNCKNIPTMKFGTKKYWKTVDELSNAIDAYSKQQYKNGNRVIVEGIQISQNWLRLGYDSYKGQPVAILSTTKASSLMQEFIRDQRTDVGKAIEQLFSKSGSNWSVSSQKELKEMARAVEAKKGDAVVNEYLKKYGQRKAK